MTSTPLQVLGTQRAPLDDLLDERELLASVTPQNRTAVSARLLEQAARETDPVERKRGAEVLAHVLGAGGRRHGLRMVVSAQRRRPLSSHR